MFWSRKKTAAIRAANADEEANVLAESEQLNSLGQFYYARRQHLGNRLNCWYWVWVIWLVITICIMYGHSWYFVHLAQNLGEVLAYFEFFQKTTPLTVNQILSLYYTSKVSVVGFFIIILGIFSNRIIRLQSERRSMADRAATANTLQFILSLGDEHSDVRKSAVKFATKAMFPQQNKSRSKSRDVNIKLKDFLDILKRETHTSD